MPVFKFIVKDVTMRVDLPLDSCQSLPVIISGLDDDNNNDSIEQKEVVVRVVLPTACGFIDSFRLVSLYVFLLLLCLMMIMLEGIEIEGKTTFTRQS